MGEKPNLSVSVYSDYICPFCNIGDRRLARLAEAVKEEGEDVFNALNERLFTAFFGEGRNIGDDSVPLPEPRYFASFAAMVATCLPWKRAAASSFPLGILSPLVPAMVDAP